MSDDVKEVKKKIMKDMMESKGKDYPNRPMKLTDSNFSDVLSDYSVVVVDFYADWCGPCKRMEPVIQRLAKEYHGEVVFGKLDIDRNNRLPQKFGVSGVPTVVIFKDGNEVDRVVGAVRENGLKKRLDRFID